MEAPSPTSLDWIFPVESAREARDALSLAGAAVNEIGLFALEGASPQANAHPGRGIEVIAAIDGRLIVAAPGCVDADGVAAAFAVPVHHATWIGSHARRFEIDAGQSLAAQ